MDVRSAELTKYAANSFLATKISFMNEVAQLCERLGADVDMVRRGIGSDERIGKRFLFPGIGYGGSCFPKDVQALVKSSSEVDYDFRILNAVMDVNERQKLHLMPKIRKYFKNELKGKKFAIWGLAFKPNTDDIREAPALYMIDELLKEGATISVFDPEAMTNVKGVVGDKIHYAENQYECLEGADALIIATEWNEFRTPNFLKIVTALKNKAHLRRPQPLRRQCSERIRILLRKRGQGNRHSYQWYSQIIKHGKKSAYSSPVQQVFSDPISATGSSKKVFMLSEWITSLQATSATSSTCSNSNSLNSIITMFPNSSMFRVNCIISSTLHPRPVRSIT